MTTNDILCFSLCLLTLLGVIDCRMRLAGLERLLLRRLIEKEQRHLTDNNEQPVDDRYSPEHLHTGIASGDSR